MGSTEMKEGFNNKETGDNKGRGAMREYDGSQSYEGQATGNYIKQKTTQSSSPIYRSSILLYNNNTFNQIHRENKWRLLLLLLLLLLLPSVIRYIQRCKRSQPVNLNNITVIKTLPAVVITVSLDVQILPTGGEFGGRGGHNHIMQYRDKVCRSWSTNTFLYEA